MKIRSIAVAALAVLLVAAMPRAPFHLSALKVGKPAATSVPATPGRPLVIVAFASWCIGCVEELPQVVADYHRFKGRVDFLGVDYLDNPKAGRELVKKFGIAFPVVSVRPSNDALPPARANTPDSRLTIRMNGVTPKTLPGLLAKVGDKLPAAARAILQNVATYCKGRSDAQCLAYAAAHHVELSSGAKTTHHAKPQAPGQTTTGSPIALPHTFVIDEHGIVRADITGYNSSENAIAVQLRKLGITARLLHDNR